ncbi:hypothetical protein NUU61_000567 [Penicillium alfredii]|uniref:DUF7136 domain-containing protein n=1 Tax=Penicillium alfredii TaxID=1506179 RepID=A0A9W9KR68_9EURO|nr:uncharacterized protein NUU61_000567 [Penicillium alfredii]KAJ5114808.1 hypothetical protein NUU61_000567 [Penicillium alfredii]
MAWKLSDPEESVSFLLDSVSNTLNTESEREFVWKLRWTNCSTPANGTTSHDEHGLVEERDFAWRPSWTGRSIYFTTKRGGTQSNLTARSIGDKCDDDAQTLAFNVTKTLKAPGGSLEGKTCAVLVSPPPTPAPCKASVAPAAASSISSALTARQSTAATPVISCPAKSGGVAISEANSQLKWWAAGLVLLVGKSIV